MIMLSTKKLSVGLTGRYTPLRQITIYNRKIGIFLFYFGRLNLIKCDDTRRLPGDWDKCSPLSVMEGNTEGSF